MTDDPEAAIRDYGALGFWVSIAVVIGFALAVVTVCMLAMALCLRA